MRLPSVAADLHDTAMLFLRTYKSLGMVSVRQHKQEFLIRPKYHVTYLVHGPHVIHFFIFHVSSKQISTSENQPQAMIHVARESLKFRRFDQKYVWQNCLLIRIFFVSSTGNVANIIVSTPRPRCWLRKKPTLHPLLHR